MHLSFFLEWYIDSSIDSYLWEEWKERQKDTCGVNLSSRFLNTHFLLVSVLHANIFMTFLLETLKWSFFKRFLTINCEYFSSWWCYVFVTKCPWQSLQQDNLFDYGLFLLHSIELFLDEAPFNFNPFKLTKLSNFVSDFLNFNLFFLKKIILCLDFLYKLNVASLSTILVPHQVNILCHKISRITSKFHNDSYCFLYGFKFNLS